MLTTVQLATLKAAILADPMLSAMWTAGNPAAIALAFNEPATPSFYVWRTSVSPSEYREAIVWTEVDALTTGSKYRIWEWLTADMTLPIDASKLNVRQGLSDCWASNTTTRPNLLAIAKRLANRIEKLLATGTGSNASPATMGYEGTLTWQDINEAMGS